MFCLECLSASSHQTGTPQQIMRLFLSVLEIVDILTQKNRKFQVAMQEAHRQQQLVNALIKFRNVRTIRNLVLLFRPFKWLAEVTSRRVVVG